VFPASRLRVEAPDQQPIPSTPRVHCSLCFSETGKTEFWNVQKSELLREVSMFPTSGPYGRVVRQPPTDHVHTARPHLPIFLLLFCT
jgi:hypothetical protein